MGRSVAATAKARDTDLIRLRSLRSGKWEEMNLPLFSRQQNAWTWNLQPSHRCTKQTCLFKMDSHVVQASLILNSWSSYPLLPRARFTGVCHSMLYEGLNSQHVHARHAFYQLCLQTPTKYSELHISSRKCSEVEHPCSRQIRLLSVSVTVSRHGRLFVSISFHQVEFVLHTHTHTLYQSSAVH